MDAKELVAHRRYLHQHPETAFEEKQTQAYLKEQIAKLPIVNMWDVAGTGLLVQVCGEEGAAGLLYRSDLDALNIQENNPDISYRSKNLGKAHLCGHDGHATIALGLIARLSVTPPKKAVYVVFQPAEETGMGALALLRDKIFSSIDFTGAYAIHNLPGFEKGMFFLRSDSFSSSVTSLFCKFHGKYSHAAEPGKGINPAFAISDILHWLESKNRYAPEDKFRFSTPVCIKIGEEAYGTNPGYGELHLTLRAANHKKFTKYYSKTRLKIQEIASYYNLGLEMEEREAFHGVVQDPKLMRELQNTLEDNLTNYEFLDGPNKWGEDFGYFYEKMPTYMFGVGSGEKHPALHNDNYDFPDEIIEPTVGLLTKLFSK